METETKFTPGPWRWWTSNSVRRLSSDATGKDGDVLEAQHSSGLASVRVSDADAALIAAAPHMVSALEMIAAICTDRTCAEMARSAIAAALGTKE